MWNASSLKNIQVRCVAYSPDSRRIASVSRGTIRIWNVETHECIDTFDTIEILCGINLSGLDFSFADIDGESKRILYQNGAKVTKEED